MKTLEEIEGIYLACGGLSYGEGVTQLEHALQCAALAQAQGVAPSLVVATLLHDIGHFFEKEEEVAQCQFDDHHEVMGAGILAGLFQEPVFRPIALHVMAKRYLCYAEPDYFANLSMASRRSLVLQGGPLTQAQAVQFEQTPFWRDAIQLRRFDDLGKREEVSSRHFADYLPLMRTLLSNKSLA